MKKSDSPSLQKTVAFAATLAALGAAIGASTELAHAQPPSKNYAPLLENRGRGMEPISPGQGQNTIGGKNRVGAAQYKERTGAVQQKADRGGAGAAPGSANMLNPQPLPPKQAIGGAGGAQSPAVQK